MCQTCNFRHLMHESTLTENKESTTHISSSTPTTSDESPSTKNSDSTSNAGKETTGFYELTSNGNTGPTTEITGFSPVTSSGRTCPVRQLIDKCNINCENSNPDCTGQNSGFIFSSTKDGNVYVS